MSQTQDFYLGDCVFHVLHQSALTYYFKILLTYYQFSECTV